MNKLEQLFLTSFDVPQECEIMSLLQLILSIAEQIVKTLDAAVKNI